jgi:hypothetical protein
MRSHLYLDGVKRLWPVAAVVILLLLAAPASAEIRGGVADDPADATPTVSGVPNNLDISRVRVSYDTAGALSITVNFHHSPAALDLSQNYAFLAAFSLGRPSDNTVNAYCNTGITGTHHVFSNRVTFLDRATISGLDGYLNFARTSSPDGREVTISATSPALANRDLRCLDYALYARRYSSASNLNSDYDSVCDCWYVSLRLDDAGDPGLSFPTIWFNGFKPQPPPQAPPPSACSNRIDDDDDGFRDMRDPGCENAEDTSEENPAPRLSGRAARRDVLDALGYKLGAKFRNRRAYKTHCVTDEQNARRAVVACRVSWLHKRYRFRGWVTIIRNAFDLKTFELDIRRRDLKTRRLRQIVRSGEL